MLICVLGEDRVDASGVEVSEHVTVLKASVGLVSVGVRIKAELGASYLGWHPVYAAVVSGRLPHCAPHACSA